MTAYLETDRLRLRAPTPDDAHALAVERSCDFVMRYNLYRPSTAEEIAEELEAFEHIIVEKSDTGELVGCISLRDDALRYHIDSLEIQAWLAERFAGQGYMTEALRALIPRLFTEREIDLLSVRIMSANTASVRLVEGIGFKKEGCIRRAVRHYDGRVFDMLVYSITRSDLD